MTGQSLPTLIQGGRIIDPASGLDAAGDILLQDGRVVWRSASGLPCPVLPGQCEVVAAQGRIVAPGFVDLHCHLREPGYEHKETIATGTRAAAAGGFTTVCCMANTNPVMDQRSVVEFVLRTAREQGVVRVLPIGAVTKGLAGKELASMNEMAEAGAVAFSDDGQPIWDNAIMRHALEYSLALGRPIIDHCQDPALTKDATMHEGMVSAQLGVRGWPYAGEDVMIARNIELARLTGARVHIAHLSTAGGVELVRRAKAEGLPVTAEVTPHHLTLTDARALGCGHGLVGLAQSDDCAAVPYDTAARVAPPLRTEDDIAALLEGLRDGAIDCIATDHAPHALEDKLCEFDQAANGITTFETAFGALMSLVHRGAIDLNLLIEKLTVGPARFLNLGDVAPQATAGSEPAGLDRPVEGRGMLGRSFLVPSDLGMLTPGAPADLVIIDPDAEWVVNPAHFHSKGKNTPLAGVQLKGRVVATYAAGVRVHEVAQCH